MKIYPGKHTIASTQNIDLNTDIPLAYIDTKSTDYGVNVISLLQKNEKKEVLPYSYFDSQDICFFDKDGNRIPGSSYLERDGAKYKFKPELIPGTSSFVPLDYNYRIVGKRNCLYKSDYQYNIKVACIDSLPDMQLSQKLIPLFGDAPDRGICPNNIAVNNKDKSLQALTNSAIEGNDFIFVESSNGLQQKSYWGPGLIFVKNQTAYVNGIRYVCNVEHTSVDTWDNDQHPAGDNSIQYWSQVAANYIADADSYITIDDYMDRHVNLWICTDDYATIPKTAGTYQATVSSPVAVRNDNINFSYAFNLISLAVKDDVVIWNMFNSNSVPVIIYEYINKGFVVVTPKEFMDNINDCTDMFYEVMMQIYLKAYVQSQSYSDWISDKMPTYIVSNGKLIQKERFATRNEIYKLFGLQRGELQLIDVKIGDDCPYVLFDGFINDYVSFKKRYDGDYAKYADKCSWNGITVYTSGKIVLMTDFIYTIEESVTDRISYDIENSKIKFTIKAFRSSMNNISSSATNMEYSLAGSGSVLDSINMFLCYAGGLSFVNTDSYDNTDGIKIAEIQITKKSSDNVIFDMRQKGGGLPEIAEPNYNLLDIGDINGKAYRKAGTIVITLPERLKPYEDMILDAVKKHMVADEFPIILFE